MGVTAIDDDIAALKMSFKFGNELINSRSSFYKEDNLSGLLQLGAKFFNAPSTLDFGTLHFKDVL